jgi:hypothetical protein
MRRLLACALVLVSGCKGASTSVLLTISASSTVSSSDVAAITQLSYSVTGAETYHKTVSLGRAFSSTRQERELYKATAPAGMLSFSVTALDSAGKNRGFGTSSVALQAGKTVPLTVSLTNQAPPTVDANKSTVTIDKPTGLVANGNDKATITVTLLDGNGVPQANQMVQLAATGMADTLTQPMGPTDMKGVATATLSTTVAEMKTVTATANPGLAQVVLAQQPTVTFSPSTAVKLAFMTQPASAATDAAITPAVTVAVLDNNGLPVAGAFPITLALSAANPQHASLAGDLIATTDASSGVATFSNLSLNLTGTYAISATSPMLTSATSTNFTITALAWTESNTGLWGGVVQGFFPDPHHPNVAYAAAQGGTFKTTNGGMDWYSADSGLPAGRNVAVIAYHPTNALVQVAVVYAAASSLYQTTNGGASWSALAPTGIDNSVNGWAWDTANSSTVYVWGGGKTGVTNSFYKSSDGGMTFTPTGNSDFSATFDSGAALFAEDSASGALYVCETNQDGSSVGVYRSTNGGAHWTIDTTGATSAYGCYALIVDSSGNVWWGGNGIYRIAGSSWGQAPGWTTLNTGLAASPQIQTIVQTPGDAQTLYAVDSGSGGLYKTSNAGAMWTKVSAAPVGSATGALALAADQSGTLLYAGGQALDGPYVSTTAGSLWTFAGTGIRVSDVSALAVDKKAPGTVYALAGTHIMRSMDAGVTWSVVGNGGFGNGSPIAVDPLNDYYVYAGNVMGGFYSSNSGGSFMAFPGTYGGGWILALAIDPNTTPSTIFAGTNTNVIWKSINNGATWAQAGTMGLASGAISAQSLGVDTSVSPSIIYANVNNNTGSGFYKSVDHGATWTSLSQPGSILRTFAIDPKTPSIIYGGYDQGNVYKSINSGGSFILSNTGLGTANAQVLIVDPVTDSNVYLASTSFGAGLYKSTNAAGMWAPANKGLKDISVYGLAIDPITPTTLYAGTPHGVFKTTTGAQ